MLSPLIHTWNLNLGYAKRLVADITDDQMAFQPAAAMNLGNSRVGYSCPLRLSFRW